MPERERRGGGRDWEGRRTGGERVRRRSRAVEVVCGSATGEALEGKEEALLLGRSMLRMLQEEEGGEVEQ